MGQRPDTIGALSKATGVKVTTIRYYESIGLLPEPARSGSGQRVYDASGFERLEFIRHARDLGFSVETIRDLIALQTDPSEMYNRAEEFPELASDLLTQMQHFARETKAEIYSGDN